MSKARPRKTWASLVRSCRRTKYPGARERDTRSDSVASLYPSIPRFGSYLLYSETDPATPIHATLSVLFCLHALLGDYMDTRERKRARRGEVQPRRSIPKDAIIAMTRRVEGENVITTSRQIDIANDSVLVPGGRHGAIKRMKRAFLRMAEGHLSGSGALEGHRDRV